MTHPDTFQASTAQLSAESERSCPPRAVIAECMTQGEA